MEFRSIQSPAQRAKDNSPPDLSVGTHHHPNKSRQGRKNILDLSPALVRAESSNLPPLSFAPGAFGHSERGFPPINRWAIFGRPSGTCGSVGARVYDACNPPAPAGLFVGAAASPARPASRTLRTPASHRLLFGLLGRLSGFGFLIFDLWFRISHLVLDVLRHWDNIPSWPPLKSRRARGSSHQAGQSEIILQMFVKNGFA